MSFFSHIAQQKQQPFVAFVKSVGCSKQINFSVNVTPILVSPLQVIRLRNVYLELRV